MQPPLSAADPPRPMRFTRERYERMVEAGIFGPGDKVELLHGEIVVMSPRGIRHQQSVRALSAILWEIARRDAVVNVQLPFAAGSAAEPEPDLYLSEPGAGAKGVPVRALLVIEVADTSLQHDRTVKASIYAGAEVRDFWIVDVHAQVVEVHRDPRGDHYGTVFTVGIGGQIELLALPGRHVVVADIFGLGRQ